MTDTKWLTEEEQEAWNQLNSAHGCSPTMEESRSILRRLAAERERNAELAGALQRYGTHTKGRGTQCGDGVGCVCGLDAALARNGGK